jgi:hypothetical protein
MADTSQSRLRLTFTVMGMVALLSASCNSSTWSDPFASPPVGQKFFVPASSPSDQTIKADSNGNIEPRATFIKLSDRNGASLPFKSITLISSQGSREIYTSEKIQQNNTSANCKSIEQDYADFFRVYPGMSVICGVEFTKALSAASGVVFTSSDGKELEFTSWGTQWSEMSDYRVTVQSFSL